MNQTFVPIQICIRTYYYYGWIEQQHSAVHVPMDAGGNCDRYWAAVEIEAEAFCAMGTLCQLRRPLLLLLLLLLSKMQ